jgi:hypothetical protein
MVHLWFFYVGIGQPGDDDSTAIAIGKVKAFAHLSGT